MSAIATFTRLPVSALERLRTDFDQTIEDSGESVADYDWSGYVLVTLLTFLEEHDISLLGSRYSDLEKQLSENLGATIVILTLEHKTAFLEKLAPWNFSIEALRDYYNEFNGTDDAETGEAMLVGIATIRQCLATLDQDSVVVLSIG